MAISITIAETDADNSVLHSATKTLSAADADRFISANQSDANTAINGSASRNQVIDCILGAAIKRQSALVQAFESQKAIAALPAPQPIVAK